MNQPSGRISGASRPSRTSIFGLSLPFSLSGKPAAPKFVKSTVSQVKLQTELCFQDLEGTQADRLRLRIRSCTQVQELWLIRSDIHQLLAQCFSQAEASARINHLLPHFKGWIPDRQLAEI